MEDILYVLILKKSLPSVSVIEYKGFQVIFMDNQALLWPKNKELKSVAVIRVRERGLYKVLGKYIEAMVRNKISPSNLWHRMLAHLHYKALPGL